MKKVLPQAHRWFLHRFLLGIGVFLGLQAFLIMGGVPLALHIYQSGQKELLIREALGVIMDHQHPVSLDVLAGGPFIVFDIQGNLVFSNRGQGRSLDPANLTPVVWENSQVGWVYTGETAFLTQEANKRFLFALGGLFLFSLAASLGVGLVWTKASAGRLTGLFRDLKYDITTLSSRTLVPARDAPFQELEDISRGLEDLGNSLRESDQHQREFLQDIAHDLRTPLSGIRGQLEALADGVLDPETRRFQAMIGETDRLVTMISNITLLFQTESFRAQIRELVSIPDLFKDLHYRFERQISERKIEWKVYWEIPHLFADRNLVLRALGNLIENSLTYGAEMKTLKLGAQKEGSRSILWVEDDGPGVLESDLTKIFQRHWRGDPGRSTPGSGLGLSIVASIANMHGGSATAFLVKSGGLRVELSFPIPPMN